MVRGFLIFRVCQQERLVAHGGQKPRNLSGFFPLNGQIGNTEDFHSVRRMGRTGAFDDAGNHRTP